MVAEQDKGTSRSSFSDPVAVSDEITEKSERAMRNLAVLTRIVGWVWMLALVIATLLTDDGANDVIVIGAMLLATVWMVVTIWAARYGEVFGSLAFVASDCVVALLVGGASYASGAADLFHGGYLIPSLIVAAYGAQMAGVLVVGFLISLEQVATLVAWGNSPVSSISSLGFILWGVIFAWLFGTIRSTDRARREAVEVLIEERENSARSAERLEMANRLHDSVLQTLVVMENDAGDEDRVRSLARKQARELRLMVQGSQPLGATSLCAAIEAAAARVSELFGVEVSTVCRSDTDATGALMVLVDAAKEAMVNAAKHSGSDVIHVYSTVEDGAVSIFVRDDGVGFDLESADRGRGLDHSIRARVESLGGDVCIESELGRGAEIRVSLPMAEVPAT